MATYSGKQKLLQITYYVPIINYTYYKQIKEFLTYNIVSSQVVKGKENQNEV